MVDFYKKGNIQNIIGEARTYMQNIREDQSADPDDARTITILRGGQNPSRGEFAWDGEKLTTVDGLEQQHFQSKEMQSKYYVTHNLNKLQLEQEEIAEQLKLAHPDGVGYSKGTDQILSKRLKEIQANAPDEASRFEITTRGEQYRKDALKAAINDENKLIRNAVGNNFEETKRDLLGQARKKPDAIAAIRLEMEDRVATAGQMLGWDPEKITRELQKQDKAIVGESIWGRAMKEGPDKVIEDLSNGVYIHHFSLAEQKAMQKAIQRRANLEGEIEKVPPIEELRRQAIEVQATGKKLNDLRQEGRMTEPELFVVAQEAVKEQRRESLPIYKHNKELLKSREPEWLPDGVKTYRLERLQALQDAGTLNEQSVALIDKETHEKLQVQANKLLAKSKYLPNRSLLSIKADVDKGNDDPTDAALLKLRKDFDAGTINQQEATEQFKILQNVKRVLSWQ